MARFITRLKSRIIVNVLRGIVFCASIFGLFFYVNECYTKLKVSPEVLVNEKLVNSRTIPFPAVTLCAPLLIKSENLNLTKCREDISQGKSLAQEDLAKIMALSHVCEENYYDLLEVNVNDLMMDVNEMDILNRISPEINEVLSECLTGQYQGCDNMYIRSLTDYGYCFSFNMLGYHSIFNDGISKDFDAYKRTKIVKSFNPIAKVEFHDDVNSLETSNWTLEGGYTSDDYFVQPISASRGRFLITNFKISYNDSFNLCGSRNNIFYVFLHMPNEIPNMMHMPNFFKINRDHMIKISAEIKRNDETLKNFDMKERGCFFEGERSLKFFKSYTKANCEYECKINFTQEHCGCVSLSMPRTDDMKVCKLKDVACFEAINKVWSSIYFTDPQRRGKYPDFLCDCMPLCTQIKYTIADKFSDDENNLSDGFMNSSIAIIFEDSQIIKRTNYVTYKVHNFISDIGGLMGLFLGFSLLSLFELMLRICSCLKRITEGWTCRLKRKVAESRSDDSLTEVISLKQLRWFDDEPVDHQLIENIFIVSNRPSTPLEIEDLESY